MSSGGAFQTDAGAFSSAGACAGGAYRIAGPGCGAVPGRCHSEVLVAGAGAGSASAAIVSATMRGAAARAARGRLLLMSLLPLAVRPPSEQRKSREASRTQSLRVPKTRDYLV